MTSCTTLMWQKQKARKLPLDSPLILYCTGHDSPQSSPFTAGHAGAYNPATSLGVRAACGGKARQAWRHRGLKRDTSPLTDHSAVRHNVVPWSHCRVRGAVAGLAAVSRLCGAATVAEATSEAGHSRVTLVTEIAITSGASTVTGGHSGVTGTSRPRPPLSTRAAQAGQVVAAQDLAHHVGPRAATSPITLSLVNTCPSRALYT